MNVITLLTAPGRVLTLRSPYTPAVVVERMRADARLVAFGTGWIVQLSVPNRNRCLFAWITPDGSGSKLNGQMRTLPRVAMARVAAGAFLLLMAIVMAYVGKVLFVFLFFLVGIGFFLTAQYERLTNLNTVRYMRWLEKQLEVKALP